MPSSSGAPPRFIGPSPASPASAPTPPSALLAPPLPATAATPPLGLATLPPAPAALSEPPAGTPLGSPDCPTSPVFPARRVLPQLASQIQARSPTNQNLDILTTVPTSRNVPRAPTP